MPTHTQAAPRHESNSASVSAGARCAASASVAPLAVVRTAPDHLEPGPGSPTVPPPVEMSAPVPAAAVNTLYALGHWLLGVERTADAADVFRVLLVVSPTDERGWLALAECHERNDQPRVALELYAAGSFAAEPSPRCLIGSARMLRTLGRDDEAAEALERAIELADEAEAVELLALARSETGVS